MLHRLIPFALFACSLPVPSAGAFVLQGGKWPQPSPGEPVTITYSYNNLLDGGLKQPDGTPLSASVIQASVEEALGLWASVAPLHFVEVPDQGGSVPRSAYPDGQFGQVRFHHLYINGPDIAGQTPKAKAQAYYPNVGDNLGGDVHFDHGDPWQVMGTLTEPDVLGAAIHEIGHALGLGHSDLPDSHMYWIFQRQNGPGMGAMLHEDDIEGIRAIYGAGVGSVRPLAIVPEPSIGALMGLLMVGLYLAQRAGLLARR